MAAVVCFGDLLIDFVPTVTGTGLADAPAFVKAPGGAAANVAVGLARLGVPSAFMGKVGDDPFGHFLADTLAAEGVDVAPLRFEPKARTALAFVSLRADGEREFMFYRHPSADMLFRPDEVDEAAIRAASVFHFDSISLAAEQPRVTVLHAAASAQAAGRLISYDVNLRLPLWQNEAAAQDGMRQGLARAHLVKLSDDELHFLTGSREPDAVRTLWHEGLKLVTLSQGSAGSVWFTGTSSGHVASFKVQAVDTTGAGDGFMAGLLAGYLNEPEALADPPRLQRLCRFANAVGALTTLQRGAIPALPIRTAVETFLAGVESP